MRDTESRNWQIDENIPVFTQDRAYIEQWLTLHSSLNCGETTLEILLNYLLFVIFSSLCGRVVLSHGTGGGLVAKYDSMNTVIWK